MEAAGIHGFVLLPIGLGLLGFIEPCTIGGHLIFVGTQQDRSRLEQAKALATFVFARAIVAGSFGALFAFLGQQVATLQTSLWIVFGLLYLALGAVIVSGRGRELRMSINLTPEKWRTASSPLFLGLAFGANIPACAAPILFGLLAMAATSGTVVTGFMMMSVFGLALSLPLIVLFVFPSLIRKLEKAASYLRQRRWILGAIFLMLGVWSIWFGLFVDPSNWAGK